MNKIMIGFCEGQHDIAFLSKILFVDGFTAYNKEIKNFIEPLNKQFIKKLFNKKIGDTKLGFQSDYMLPSVALHKNENILVLLHNLNGGDRVKERAEILAMYQNMQSEDDDFTNFNLDFRFLYFFDADDEGIATRIEGLNTALDLSDTVEHSKIKVIDKYEWGCYVFHKDENSGDLEDILLDLMRLNNESIFANSASFLASNQLHKNRQKEFSVFDETYKDKVKFQKKKSIISVAGQLQFSSMSNSVIIARSDYIKKSDIKSNKHCQDISKLF